MISRNVDSKDKGSEEVEAEAKLKVLKKSVDTSGSEDEEG